MRKNCEIQLQETFKTWHLIFHKYWQIFPSLGQDKIFVILAYPPYHTFQGFCRNKSLFLATLNETNVSNCTINILVHLESKNLKHVSLNIRRWTVFNKIVKVSTFLKYKQDKLRFSPMDHWEQDLLKDLYIDEMCSKVPSKCML